MSAISDRKLMPDYLKNKKLIFTITFIFLTFVGIMVGIYLVRQRQQITSRAVVAPVEFTAGECVILRAGNLVATCPNVQFTLNSPALLPNGCFQSNPNNLNSSGVSRLRNPLIDDVLASEPEETGRPKTLLAQAHTGDSLSASPNPCLLETGQSLCSSTISWSTSGASNVCVLVDNGGPFACGVSGIANAPWINAGGNLFEMYKDFISLQDKGTRLASLTVTAHAASQPSPSHSPSPSPSPLPSPSPSSSPLPSAISCSQIFYKFSETAQGLANAQEQLLDISPKTISYSFLDTTPGVKSIYVEFSDGEGGIEREKAEIPLLAPSTQNQNSPSPSLEPSSSPSLSPSPSPSVSAVVSPSPVASSSTPGTGGPKEVVYRLAETEAGLNSAVYKPYNQTPTLADFVLADDLPGTKQIWVEFRENSSGQTNRERLTVRFINKPRIQEADCTLNINKQDLRVTLSGSGLGNGPGTLKSDQTDLDILGWNDNQIIGVLKKPGVTPDNGKTFQFNLTRNDKVPFDEPIICRVDTSMVALGARIFCREPGNFDVPNVKIILTDKNNNRSEETVTIAKDGTISGLKTRLQEGRLYAITIDAPYSLRRNALFIAGSGTTFVTREDDSPFILPVGDVAPVILEDGKINTLDRSEIVRQWSVLGKAPARSADFNRDTKVNSIDWACMRYDFNNEDEPLPDLVSNNSSFPGSGSITIPLSSSPSSQLASPSPSSSPFPSGQRAAYFLPIPAGSGTYPLNTEFALDINMWSQSEAANLFSAQMSFNPAVLEVVRIDKGTALTSWTDSSFDNTAGEISLVAGLPTPGLKTAEGNDPLMAKIIFKSKQVGTTTINMTAESAIYSNSDNTNIISGLISAPVEISQ